MKIKKNNYQYDDVKWRRKKKVVVLGGTVHKGGTPHRQLL